MLIQCHHHITAFNFVTMGIFKVKIMFESQLNRWGGSCLFLTIKSIEANPTIGHALCNNNY